MLYLKYWNACWDTVISYWSAASWSPTSDPLQVFLLPLILNTLPTSFLCFALPLTSQVQFSIPNLFTSKDWLWWQEKPLKAANLSNGWTEKTKLRKRNKTGTTLVKEATGRAEELPRACGPESYTQGSNTAGSPEVCCPRSPKTAASMEIA